MFGRYLWRLAQFIGAVVVSTAISLVADLSRFESVIVRIGLGALVAIVLPTVLLVLIMRRTPEFEAPRNRLRFLTGDR